MLGSGTYIEIRKVHHVHVLLFLCKMVFKTISFTVEEDIFWISKLLNKQKVFEILSGKVKKLLLCKKEETQSIRL